MQDHLDAVDNLSTKQLQNVIGGKSISGTLISAFANAYKTIYGFGQDFGGALRRFKKKKLCAI